MIPPRIVAIGTSTGGTHAIEEILKAMPLSCPGIVIVQHIPEQISTAFTKRLNHLCRIEVKEAEDKDRVMPGCALIAPGGKHLSVNFHAGHYVVEVKDGPLINRHRPSVDLLFKTVARHAGNRALGIILTGMGDDGAQGLLEMHQAGARTIGQDPDSCVVYGMPRVAFEMGAVQKQIPLSQVASEIIQFAHG